MRILLGLLAVAAVAVAGVWWGPWRDGSESAPETDGTYEVTRGDLRITLNERGTLKTRQAQTVKSEVRGRARIEWIIEEGAKVEAGDVLVELDRTELEKEVEDLENRVIQLESELKSAETEVTIQIAQNLTDTEKAALELEVAEVSLQKFEEGDHPQELRKLELAIDQAQTNLERAQYRFKTMPEMLEKGFVTEDQYKEEELNVKTAEKELESAKLALELYRQYQLPLDRKQKTAAVTEAERNVQRAEQQAEARLAGKKAVVRQKKRSLDAAQERLEKARQDMDNMTLPAERHGIVFYGDPDNSRRAEEIEVGADIWPNRTILTIPDPARMMVVIRVHESDISKVEEGGTATVRSEVRRNATYEGVVSRIDSVANAGRRRWGDNVRRFNVEIDIDAAGADLKPGTSAEVELLLGTVEDVLYVPLQAVDPAEGRFFVHRAVENRIERVPVRLGRANEAFVEVKEGLEEGDEVLLYEPDPADVETVESGPDAPPAGDGSSGDATSGDGDDTGPVSGSVDASRAGSMVSSQPTGAGEADRPRPAGAGARR